MKRKGLIRELEKLGWYLKSHGGNHDVWTNGLDIEPVERHKEISDSLVKKILKRAKLSNSRKGDQND